MLRKRKYMIQPPPKRLEQLERDKLQGDLTNKLIKMIGAMIKEKSDEKKDYWFSFINKANAVEKELILLVRDIFEDEEKGIIAILDNSKAIKGRETQFLPKLSAMKLVWLGKLLPFIKELVIKVGGEKLTEVKVGGQIDITTPAMVRFFNKDLAKLVKGITETTRNQLKKELIEGFELGEGVEQLKTRVQKVYTNASKNRARMIARTETIKTSNFAADQAFKQSGVVTGKEWLTTLDGRQDFACDELDGKIVDVDKDFVEEGDAISADGNDFLVEADVGFPPLHVSCRCTLLPVVIET